MLEEEPTPPKSLVSRTKSLAESFKGRLGISFAIATKEFFFGLIVLNNDVVSGESLKSKTEEVKPRKGPDRIVSI